jgi:hypothetical protein
VGCNSVFFDGSSEPPTNVKISFFNPSSMNHNLLVCLLTATIAAPSASNIAKRMNHPQASIFTTSEEPLAANQSTVVKPGKSKKYKKKMSKQMKKRKRH